MPQTVTNRFEHIKPDEDVDLANYLVSANNTFKTHWAKSSQLKDRTFYPCNHPEYVKEPLRNHRKRDRVVEFREAMLWLQNMMNGPKRGKE